jgi:Ca-activated chloride channel family protein
MRLFAVSALVLFFAPQAVADEPPGEGVLMAVDPSGKSLGPCPLEHTDVDIAVAGDLVTAHVTQRFRNPFDHRLEAVYAFPLPEHAAVHGFRMAIGARTIEGVLEKRGEARRDYEKARDRGEAAALLDQERPNLFTQTVANIAPGGTIAVTLDYVDVLPYRQGAYHLAFPLTIGPRYIGADVADGDRISPPTNLGGRPARDVAMTVTVDTGVPLLERGSGPGHARVTLARGDTVPNRDFLLDLSVAPAAVAAGVVAHTERPGEGYLKLLLVPTDGPADEDVTPKEIVFVLDTSGSMYGQPMELSKAVMRRALTHLRPEDTFAVLRYNDVASALSPAPLANTPANVSRALAAVDHLQGEGGTDALGGVRAAFAYPHEEGHLRIVVFMTDGFIGNDTAILAEIRQRIGASRLFAVGIGSSVNRYLIGGMAAAGRGAEVVVTPRDKTDDLADRIFTMIDRPYLTDVAVDWNGLDVTEPSRAPLPDLFAGQPVTIFARYRKGGHARARITGRLGGKPWSQVVDVALPESEPRNAVIATLWARQLVERLQAEAEERGTSQEERITELALSYTLVTPYTSFVAVEHRADAPGTPPAESVKVASELPEGVSPDRIFGTLSLQRFQPGDPELRVHAPAGARDVTVVFPFGETKTATWDARQGAWTVRFLVPPGTPEGVYAIHILVTLDDGARALDRELYRRLGTARLHLEGPRSGGARTARPPRGAADRDGE